MMRGVGMASRLGAAIILAATAGGGMAGAEMSLSAQKQALVQSGMEARRNQSKREAQRDALMLFGDLGGYRKRPFRTVAQDKRDARKARNKRRR